MGLLKNDFNNRFLVYDLPANFWQGDENVFEYKIIKKTIFIFLRKKLSEFVQNKKQEKYAGFVRFFNKIAEILLFLKTKFNDSLLSIR